MKLLPAIRASLLAMTFGSVFLSAQSSLPSPLQPFVDRHELAGAVTLVANQDKVLELRAVGYEDIAAQKPMQTDSLFWIASQSKPIVATATMMLVDEGKISLDDPVTKYIPEFKEQWLLAEQNGDHTLLKKPEHPILIRHLLSHMSGMLYKTPIEQPTLDILNEEQRMHAYVMSPLQFEPGTKHLYANTGMNTAARIVELVSGMHYEDFIQQRILNPLHMKDTTFWPTKKQLERLAKSYAPNAAKTGLEEVPSPQLRYPLDDRTRCVQPAGGLFSTASDLLNFYRMIMAGGVFEGERLLSEHAVQQMTSKQTGGLPRNYGFGFDTTPGKIGHGGTFGTLSAMDREHHLISIVMVQYGGPAANLGKFHGAFRQAVMAQYVPEAAAAKPAAETKDKSDASSLVANRARYFPAKGGEAFMAGGTFFGSNVSKSEGFEKLAVIKDAPTPGQWNEVTFENSKIYRWLRYVGQPGSLKKACAIEFWADTHRLAATQENRTNDPFPSAEAPDSQVITLDLMDAVTAHRPSFSPGAAPKSGPVDVTITSNPGAVIRYTLDGTWPTAKHGEVYQKPVHLEKTGTVEAAAFEEGHPASIPSSITYLMPGSSEPGLSSAHIGNSLTGITGNFFRYARTAGRDHHSTAFLRGGALTRELWALASGEYASDPKASEKEAAALKRGSLPWDKFWQQVPKIDLLTVQPRDFDLDKEVQSEVKFFNRFREKSPDLQPWLYCEWVEQARQRPSDKGEVPSSEMKKTWPALTWEESMGAMLLYVEELQKKLDKVYHGPKRPRIIPSALAMGWIRNMIDHGRLPGIKPGSFYPLLFADQVHPNVSATQGGANGAFLVDMTWYSAFYREPSEGKVLPIETSFTPEQARIIQRLAWDVVKNYPDCGLYEEGKTPCGAPTFSTEKTEGQVKRINLLSTTPGTWFRYTLDGTEPARTNGYVYCGVISFRPGMTLKAVAYKSGMADSPVATMP